MSKYITRDERGSIAVIGGFAVATLIGSAALAVELGNVYQTQVRDQRAADVAALGTAMSYQGNPSVDISGVATSLVMMNGVPTSAVVTAALNTRSDGNKAIQVTVSTPVPILMARVVSSITSINASATATAEIKPGSGLGCIVALHQGDTTGVNVGGGVNFTASNCAVLSASVVTAANCNTPPLLTAQSIYLVASSINQPTNCGSGTPIQTTPKAANFFPNSAAPTDTVATNPAIVSAFATLAQVQAMTGPAAPATVASNTPINVSNSTATETAKAYSTAAVTSSTVSFTGSPTITTSISGTLTLKGDNTINLGAGNYIINGDLTQINYGTTTFNTVGVVNLQVGGSITQSGSGSISFGNANITVGNNITTAGSQNMTFGTGTMRVAGSVNNGSSGTMSLGNSGDTTKPLQIAGSLTSTGSGVLSVGAGDIQIKGDLNIAESTSTPASFGAGTVTVGGNLTVSNGTIAGTGTSLIVGGTSFSVSGSGNFNMSAPDTGASAGVPNVVIAAPNATTFYVTAGGTTNVMSGLVYAPKAPMQMNGGQQVNSQGKCLELVAASISLTAGAGAFTNCPNLGIAASGGGAVALVQ
jgi:hypothetical protein